MSLRDYVVAVSLEVWAALRLLKMPYGPCTADYLIFRFESSSIFTKSSQTSNIFIITAQLFLELVAHSPRRHASTQMSPKGTRQELGIRRRLAAQHLASWRLSTQTTVIQTSAYISVTPPLYEQG